MDNFFFWIRLVATITQMYSIFIENIVTIYSTHFYAARHENRVLVVIESGKVWLNRVLYELELFYFDMHTIHSQPGPTQRGSETWCSLTKPWKIMLNLHAVCEAKNTFVYKCDFYEYHLRMWIKNSEKILKYHSTV